MTIHIKQEGMLFISLVLCLLMVSEIESRHVLGIDFGSEYFKVYMVQNNNIDILENESSRKTGTVLSLRDGERQFGKLALNSMVWDPLAVFPYMRDMLGRESLSSSIYKEITKHILYEDSISLNTTDKYNFITVKLGENSFGVHELLAMILQRVKIMSEKATGAPIIDVILTVPSFYTHRERQALIETAKIAGLNVLSLIDQGTAWGLSYARKLSKIEKPQTVLFFDLGQSSLQLSLFNFSNTTILNKQKNKLVDAIVYTPIQRVWNIEVGGREFEKRMADFVETKILEKYKLKSIDKKTRAKIMLKVKSAKELLSANTEAQIKVESGDIEVVVSITRDMFENICSDIFQKVTNSLNELLTKSNLNVNDIQFVEIVGGISRIPKIQSTLKEFFKRENLDFHLNGDEAAAFGAAVYGRIRNRVTNIKIKDSIDWSASVNISDINSDIIIGDEEVLSKVVKLFPNGTRIGSKKKFTFPYEKKFSVNMKYELDEYSSPYPDDLNLLIDNYEITGIPTSKDYNLTNVPSLSITFHLTPSGTYELEAAEATFNYSVKSEPKKEKKKVEKEVNKEKTEPETNEKPESDKPESDKSESDKPESDTDDSNKDEEKDTDDDEQETNENKDSKSGEDEQKSENQESNDSEKEEIPIEQVPEYLNKTKTITLIVKRSDIHKLPFQVRIHSKAVLQKWDDIDKLRITTQNAKNELESYIFQMRESLYDENFISMSTEEERETLSTKLTEASEWLENEGEHSKLEIYKSKKSDLETNAKKIDFRIKESIARPEAISKCLGIINVTREYIPDIVKNQQVTIEEIENLLKSCNEIEQWLVLKYKEQEGLELFKDPVLTSTMVDQKCNIVNLQLKMLTKRPYRPKEKKNATKPEGSSNSEKTDTEKSDGETKPEPKSTDTGNNDNQAPEQNSKNEEKSNEKAQKDNHQDL